MTTEDQMRRIVAENKSARDKAGQRMAQLVTATVAGDYDEFERVIDDTLRDFETELERQNAQVFGSAGADQTVDGGASGAESD